MSEVGDGANGKVRVYVCEGWGVKEGEGRVMMGEDVWEGVSMIVS